MKQICKVLIVACAVLVAIPSFSQKKKAGKNVEKEYVVLASASVKADAVWMEVVNALQAKHEAEVLFFDKAPRESLEALKTLRPRYVAIVETPENLGRDYVIDVNKMSREVDDDIYADYLCGIITGYDAAAAMKMVNNSTEPFVIHNAVATIHELCSAKWFDTYGWLDDHTMGLWGEKTSKDAQVTTGNVPREKMLDKFTELYAKYAPDLVVTAAHATERNLEMPYSMGNIIAKEGKLYARSAFESTNEPLKESGKRKVYFAVGNCLIGNVNNTNASMAIGWMNSGNAATMIGYVVTTWHGRNGWGGLKYWLTTPGRYTLAEAVYMNQQDMLYQLNEWSPKMLTEDYPTFEHNEFSLAPIALQKLLGKQPTNDQVGFWHDRDVLAFYGDPKWDVRLQQIPEENDYTVTTKMKGKQCVVTITTHDNFKLELLKGNKFKQEHVLDLPFSYFFPERLNNPRLAEGQEWKAAVDENFLIIYNCDFEPGKTYEVILDIDK